MSVAGVAAMNSLPCPRYGAARRECLGPTALRRRAAQLLLAGHAHRVLDVRCRHPGRQRLFSTICLLRYIYRCNHPSFANGAMRFNAPPNWPQPPTGWTPPPNWFPDPAWGPAPEGWQFWIEDGRSNAASNPTSKRKAEKKRRFSPARLQNVWSYAASSDNRHWIFGGTGLAAGLLLGVVVGAGASSSPATPSAADSSRAEVGLGSTAIETAVEDCGLMDAAGISVGDEGHSVAMQTTGEENTDGADIFEVACVLQGLDASDSVIARMDSTRALDGRQTGTWGDFEASWGYHPDDGLDLVVEETQ